MFTNSCQRSQIWFALPNKENSSNKKKVNQYDKRDRICSSIPICLNLNPNLLSTVPIPKLKRLWLLIWGIWGKSQKYFAQK